MTIAEQTADLVLAPQRAPDILGQPQGLWYSPVVRQVLLPTEPRRVVGFQA